MTVRNKYKIITNCWLLVIMKNVKIFLLHFYRPVQCDGKPPFSLAASSWYPTATNSVRYIMQISISKFSLIFSFAFTASILDHGLKKLSYVHESGRHDKRRNRCGIEGKDSISLPIDSISLDSAQERVHHFLRILVTRFQLTVLFSNALLLFVDYRNAGGRLFFRPLECWIWSPYQIFSSCSYCWIPC